MCGAILSYQSGSVEAEDDIQSVQRHIVDDIVEGALREAGVDVTEG